MVWASWEWLERHWQEGESSEEVSASSQSLHSCTSMSLLAQGPGTSGCVCADRVHADPNCRSCCWRLFCLPGRARVTPEWHQSPVCCARGPWPWQEHTKSSQAALEWGSERVCPYLDRQWLKSLPVVKAWVTFAFAIVGCGSRVIGRATLKIKSLHLAKNTSPLFLKNFLLLF